MTHLGKLIKTQIPVTCSKRGPGFRIQIQEILDRTLESTFLTFFISSQVIQLQLSLRKNAAALGWTFPKADPDKGIHEQ